MGYLALFDQEMMLLNFQVDNVIPETINTVLVVSGLLMMGVVAYNTLGIYWVIQGKRAGYAIAKITGWTTLLFGVYMYLSLDLPTFGIMDIAKGALITIFASLATDPKISRSRVPQQA
jgi:hypothetical protein